MAANAIILTPSSRIACWTPNFQSAQKTPNPSFKVWKTRHFLPPLKKHHQQSHRWRRRQLEITKTGHCWKCQERRLTRSTKRPGATVYSFYLLPSRVGVGVWLGWFNLASEKVMITKKIIKWWFSMRFMTVRLFKFSFHFSPDSHQAFTNLLVENSNSLSYDLMIWEGHFPLLFPELFGKTER